MASGNSVEELIARAREVQNPEQAQKDRAVYGTLDLLNEIIGRNSPEKSAPAIMKYNGYTGLAECVDRLVDIQKEMELQLQEKYSVPLRFARGVREFWYSRVLGKATSKPTIEGLVDSQLDNLDILNGNLHQIIEDSREVYDSMISSWQNVHGRRQAAITERKRLENLVKEKGLLYKELDAIVANLTPDDERYEDASGEREKLYDSLCELDMFYAQEEQNIVFKTNDLKQIKAYKDMVRMGLKACRDISNQLGNFAESLRGTKQVFGLVQRQAGTVQELLRAFDATTGYVTRLVDLSGQTIREMSYIASNEQRGWNFPSDVAAQLHPYITDITAAASKMEGMMHQYATAIVNTPGG